MEVTGKGIPTSLRPFFQEYNLDDLDPAQDAFTIIERTMARGKRAELRWLFQVYRHEQLREWVIKAGWRMLPRRRLAFWAVYFNLNDLPERKNAWPH